MFNVFLLMTFILLIDLIILKKKMEAIDDLHLAYRSYYSKKIESYKVTIPLQGKVTIVVSILPDTKVGFMIMQKHARILQGLFTNLKILKLFHFRTISSIWGTFHLQSILILRQQLEWYFA